MFKLILICCFSTQIFVSHQVELSDLFQISKPVYIYENVTADDEQMQEENVLIKDSLECGKQHATFFGSKVVGGSTASRGEFPWQVSLQLQTGLTIRHICGGAILSDRWIITAAHCVKDIKNEGLSIVAGDYDIYLKEGTEQRRKVSKIFVHSFDIATFKNDIALLKLATSLQYYSHNMISPICLPSSSDHFYGEKGVIAGWGRLHENGDSPGILQKVAIPIISKEQCREDYRYSGYLKFLQKCQICAGVAEGGKDACQGDSGGPLVCKKENTYYLCGVVSWGIGCGRPQFPGVYTEVACYVDWIEGVISKNQD